MYGLVNKAVEQLVLKDFGEEKWTEIKKRAGVEESFVAMGTYPDEVTFNLVGAASEVLGAPAEAILEAFGEHWIQYTVDEGYGPMMSMYGSSVFEFLQNMNSLHSQIRLSFPELKPPSITCEELPDGQLLVDYESEREGLAPMLVGLLRGLGKRFKTPVNIEHVPTNDTHAGHAQYKLSYVKEQAA
jgi:hypothetical protein